jgi:hypothetical protein
MNDVLVRTADIEWTQAFPGAWVKRLRSCDRTLRRALARLGHKSAAERTRA